MPRLIFVVFESRLRAIGLSDFRWACPGGITTGRLQRSAFPRSPLGLPQWEQRLGSFLAFQTSQKITEMVRWLRCLHLRQIVKEPEEIEAFSFNSCERAIESLLPSGQAGRRAFFNGLTFVA